MGARRDPQPGAISVQTFGEAVRWLFLNVPAARMQAVIDDGAPLPSAARLICDIYWLNEGALRRELARFWYPERYRGGF